ncbi:MAG: alpha/beta fold hydrolase [Candidatus Diapherotrites archaeon]|uniref:Alpha/beta fold hydrolase n=1 Tax=Candidatus Iainarchaeum sp. TaxID=3101447 RepID=A0A8T3YQ83_9ARCH|nr:alpha/beta fold hydrolase [Candidatus Diapherotrites archaeon]
MKKAFTVFVFLFLLVGCTKTAQEQGAGEAGIESGGGVLAGSGDFEKVSFRTEDGFTIAANLWRGGKAVVLLHQFQLDKASYGSLAAKLADANYTVLAIDLRGHGESLDRNGLKIRHSSFSGQDFRDMAKDVKAAKKYLQQEGFAMHAIVGSSIGANTAVNYSAQDASVEKIVLLSPGMEFKGIDAGAQARSVKAKALIVASDDDPYSFTSGQALAKLINGAEFMPLRNAGHGTYMFLSTNLEEKIVQWISK